MTDLHKAAQQALDALENSVDLVRHEYITDWRHGLPTRKAQLDGMKEGLDAHEATITALKAALEQQAEPICPECKAAVLYECVACSSNNYPPKQQAEPVAWDVFELRLYGAPQEKQHRVLWVDRYAQPDGSTPDLDTLLEAAKTEGGIDGRAKTLHVRPLYTTSPQRPWVGLTDEEIHRTTVLLGFNPEWKTEIGMAHAVVRNLETKLKERNT